MHTALHNALCARYTVRRLVRGVLELGGKGWVSWSSTPIVILSFLC